MSDNAPSPVPGLPDGHGRPCVIVPLVAPALSGLRDEVAALTGSPAQMAEWRADLYQQARTLNDIVAVARELSAALGEAARRAGGTDGGERATAALPLLFTYRTRSEGGAGIAGERDYAMLTEAIAGSGSVAAVDVEYRHPLGPTVIGIARSEGAAVIASAHDFTATPPAQQLDSLLNGMEQAGADAAKIAVMPRSPADVVRLLDVTVRARERLSIPVITIAMGPLGLVTRLAGEVFGSAATFAAVGAASAPGQIDAGTAAGVLDLFHAQLAR